jgi:hypothetical protein
MRRKATCAGALGIWLAALLAAPTRSAATDAVARYLGAASCASTPCHGSIVAREATPVLQNEYQVWSQRDAHARAYSVLGDRHSQEIASRLGLLDAQTARECLGCHAVAVAERLHGPRFQISDGVSCEACHGAAERWIETHDDAANSRTASLARGLIALDDPRVRAEVCLGCHQGNRDRALSHRIMAAGHPRLSFELDTFTQLEPAHFRIDADYRQRKQAADSATTWAVGQAMSVALYADRLAEFAAGEGPGAASVWPEFALFDCFSCHHDIGARPPASGEAGLLGVPRPDLSSLLLYREIVAQVAPDGLADYDKSVRTLVGAASGSSSRLAAAAGGMRESARTDAERLADRPLTDDTLRGVLARIVSVKTASHYRSYADAEQVTMAAQAICATLTERGALSGTRLVRSKVALDAMFDATNNPETFRASRFREALDGLRGAFQPESDR